jgi:hypothetical protein
LTIAEDGVVDYYAVDRVVVVRIDEGVFKQLAIDFSQVKSEATVSTSVYQYFA